MAAHQCGRTLNCRISVKHAEVVERTLLQIRLLPKTHTHLMTIIDHMKSLFKERHHCAAMMGNYLKGRVPVEHSTHRQPRHCQRRPVRPAENEKAQVL